MLNQFSCTCGMVPQSNNLLRCFFFSPFLLFVCASLLSYPPDINHPRTSPFFHFFFLKFTVCGIQVAVWSCSPSNRLTTCGSDSMKDWRVPLDSTHKGLSCFNSSSTLSRVCNCAGCCRKIHPCPHTLWIAFTGLSSRFVMLNVMPYMTGLYASYKVAGAVLFLKCFIFVSSLCLCLALSRRHLYALNDNVIVTHSVHTIL